MVDPISLVSAIQATTQLVEQAFRIFARLRAAHERQKDLVEVLKRHENELSGVKIIIGIIEDEEELQMPIIATELVRLEAVQNKLAELLQALDPKGKGRVNQYTRQLIHGSADERKLYTIMNELAHVKSTLLLRIQVASVRVMGTKLEANAEVIQRIDKCLKEHIENCEGLRIASLLKGRRPSNDGYVPLTRAELKSLESGGSNSECSEDETLVDESEGKTTSGFTKTERIVFRNAARHQSLQVNAPVEKDIWEDLGRLVIKDNVSEDQSLQINYATTEKMAMVFLNRQDKIIKGTKQKIECVPV